MKRLANSPFCDNKNDRNNSYCYRRFSVFIGLVGLTLHTGVDARGAAATTFKRPAIPLHSRGTSSATFIREIISIRGGAGSTKTTETGSAFDSLADFFQDRFPDATTDELIKTMGRMAAAQQTFKGLDGAAHEAYQRTRGGDEIDTSISGRAQRSASRLAATAEALLACELVELVESPETVCDESINGHTRRTILLNVTSSESNVKLGKSSKLSLLVLYEAEYDGGVGLDHGSIRSLAEEVGDPTARRGPRKGRLLIVLADTLSEDLVEILSLLNQQPKRIQLASGLVMDEVASVSPTLYQAAADVLVEIEPYLRTYNTSAIHFVGRSLAGGVASLAATMLDGSIPLPKVKGSSMGTSKKIKKKKKKQATTAVESSGDDVAETSAPSTTTSTNGTSAESTSEPEQQPEQQPLSGLGRARSSSMTLGAPPCLSSNVLAAFCTSFLYGDDVVVRTTHDSIERLYDRLERNLKGGFVGRKIGWMSDALSLTVSSLQSHARGSEGEEATLSVPGRAFLVRPRRLGGTTSIHEVGNLKKGGREALRANLLWQLHDVLLSRSMWRHHKLDSYIQGLDRVQLRRTTEVQEQDLY